MSRNAIGSLVCAMAGVPASIKSVAMSKRRMMSSLLWGICCCALSPPRERATPSFSTTDWVRGQAAPPHPTVLVELSALPSPAAGRGRNNGRRYYSSLALVDQPLADQPLLNHVRDLRVVLVLH